MNCKGHVEIGNERKSRNGNVLEKLKIEIGMVFKNWSVKDMLKSKCKVIIKNDVPNTFKSKCKGYLKLSVKGS